MGREVRRVPRNWQHPTAPISYVRLTSPEFEERVEFAPLTEEECTPRYTEPADWFQYYETVSEGTPLSPPMPTVEALAVWLARFGRHRGRTEAEWVRILEAGWMPSGMIVPGRGVVTGEEAILEDIE